MQRFEDLTRGGQVRRMRRLAETALTAYDLGEMHLRPLMHFFNTTFRIDAYPHSSEASQGNSTGRKRERYVIRIHRPGSQDVRTIQSELLWLLALRREAGLVVPEPVSTRDGALVTTASVPGVPEPRDCVVLRWVDGRFLRSQLGTEELERVGAFMAKLHRHAEGFVAPPGFFRKRWDYEGLRSAVLGTDLEQSWAHLSREDRALLDAVGERVQQAMHVLGEGREVFGLIHADFYERNYLFSNGEVHAIDFDGCGWGYYLFDIGVAFSTLLARPDYPALRQAFLEGYRRVRSLCGDHEALIDTFIAARLMCHVLWLAAHVDEPAYGLRAIRRIEYELGELQSFLERQHRVERGKVTSL
jgi:Ser/Thr protein kinase RdoA (MazF antagonist)